MFIDHIIKHSLNGYFKEVYSLFAFHKNNYLKTNKISAIDIILKEVTRVSFSRKLVLIHFYELTKLLCNKNYTIKPTCFFL